MAGKVGGPGMSATNMSTVFDEAYLGRCTGDSNRCGEVGESE